MQTKGRRAQCQTVLSWSVFKNELQIASEWLADENSRQIIDRNWGKTRRKRLPIRMLLTAWMLPLSFEDALKQPPKLADHKREELSIPRALKALKQREVHHETILHSLTFSYILGLVKLTYEKHAISTLSVSFKAFLESHSDCLGKEHSIESAESMSNSLAEYSSYSFRHSSTAIDVCHLLECWPSDEQYQRHTAVHWAGDERHRVYHSDWWATSESNKNGNDHCLWSFGCFSRDFSACLTLRWLTIR